MKKGTSYFAIALASGLLTFASLTIDWFPAVGFAVGIGYIIGRTTKSF